MALKGRTKEEQFINYFRTKGFTDFGISGLYGNIYCESGLIPNNLQNTYNVSLGMTDEEYTKAVDNGSYTNFVYDSAGYGICQWTYWSRKKNMLDFAQSHNKSIGDYEMQLDFLYQELCQSYSNVVSVLTSAKSIREASNAVLLNFERPADQSQSVQDRRTSEGQKFYDKYIITTIASKGGYKMKYSGNNKPLQCIMTNSTCYKNTQNMRVKGVLWHSTGANNPTLRRYVQPCYGDVNYSELMQKLGKNNNGNDLNHLYTEIGVNAWIGKLADGSVTTVQALPWDYRPWGCDGGVNGSCNDGWIQFEICEDGLSDGTYFNQIYKEACELTAYLCKLYNINPLGTVQHNGVTVPTILCHQDSAKLGLGSDHVDVLHWFPKFGKNMTTVRNDVAALLKGQTVNNSGSGAYQARVVASDGLNCRSEPVTGAVINTYPNGTLLTITKENGGWGYTGTGWVSLDWVQFVQNIETEDDDMLSFDDWKKYMVQYRKELQDNDCGDWSAAARDWAIANGLISGTGKGKDGKPNYAWADQLTREQAAALFYRFAQLMGKA